MVVKLWDPATRYSLTLAVELILVGTGIATLRLAAEAFGTTGFGEFTVARRTVSVLAVPLLLGTGVALARYVAYAAAPPRTYLLAAIGIVAPVVGAFALGAGLNAGAVSLAFFGSEELISLVTPTLIAIAGVGLHAIAYSYFTGQLRMGVANSLQLIDLGAAPLIAVLLSGGSASRALVLVGVVPLAASLVTLLPALLGALTTPPQRRDIAPSAARLLAYGLPRVPGDLAHFALFSVPTIVVAHRAGIEAAGFLSFGLSLVHLIDAPFAVGRTLLLPTVSRLAAAGRTGAIELLLRRTFVASAIAASLAVLAVELALAPVVDVLLGPGFSSAAQASRWLLVGAVPYGVYSVLRGAVDALAVWPHNSVNLGIALGIALILLVPGSIPAEVAVPIAFTVLAALTVRSTWSSVGEAPKAVDIVVPSMPE